jgi:hypothetical protein
LGLVVAKVVTHEQNHKAQDGTMSKANPQRSALIEWVLKEDDPQTQEGEGKKVQRNGKDFFL